MSAELKTRKIGRVFSFLTGTRESVEKSYQKAVELNPMQIELYAKKIFYKCIGKDIKFSWGFWQVEFEIKFVSNLDEWILRYDNREWKSEAWIKSYGKTRVSEMSFRSLVFSQNDIAGI